MNEPGGASDDEEAAARLARRAARRSALWLALPPLIAVFLLALGLRVGAGSPMRAAVVLTAPPPKALSGLSWQVLVVRETNGVRETVANLPLRVSADNATWTGTTNADGVAEAFFARPDLAVKPTVEVEVVATADGEVLAHGLVTAPPARKPPPNEKTAATSVLATTGGHAVPAARRDGAVLLDVVVRDGLLVAGYASDVWVHASDATNGAPIVGATITTQPEPGLTFATAAADTCRNGWAALTAAPQVHVVAAGITATTSDGRAGAWFGNLPVARGAAHVNLATSLPAGAPFKADVILPSEGRTGYLEVDDTRGRAFASTFLSRAEPPGPPHDVVTVPALGAGLYWLVTSSDPRGAESTGELGTTVARPFVVLSTPADRCNEIAELARARAPAFARDIAVDGMIPARARALDRRRQGLTIAFSALAVAAALEVLLVIRRARKARANALSVLVGLCVVLLGFALLALLAATRPR